MSAVGEEIMGSRGGNLKGLSRKYHVAVSSSSTPENDVIEWVLNNAPSHLYGLVLNDITLDEDEELEDEYEATAQYGELEKTQPPETGSMEYRFSFQSKGGHFYQSLATIASYARSDLSFGAADFGGALNVVQDAGKNKVEGFQVEPPPETFTLAYFPVNAVVTPAYQNIVEGLCGQVNNASFRGKSAGSLMLVRVAGGVRTGEDWSIEFGFGYVPNQTMIPVGDGITVTSKDGLDLLWPYYGTKNDTTAKVLVQQPAYAYVERVWYRGDFNQLNLPS